MRTPDGPPKGGPFSTTADQDAARLGPPHWHVVYTRLLQERAAADALEEAGAEEVVIPFHLATLREDAADPRRALLFPCYVFFRACLSEAFRSRVERTYAICYIAGAFGATASRVEDHEMNLVRELMHSARFPLLGEAPARGTLAQIVSGPLAGIRGIVMERTAREARIATRVQLIGQTCEVTVPLDAITLLSVHDQSLTTKARHRGGARARRRAAAPLKQVG